MIRTEQIPIAHVTLETGPKTQEDWVKLLRWSIAEDVVLDIACETKLRAIVCTVHLRATSWMNDGDGSQQAMVNRFGDHCFVVPLSG